MYIRHKTMTREYTKNVKSKTLDIIALYLLTPGSAAYKVATVKSFVLGFHILIGSLSFLQLTSTNSASLAGDVCTLLGSNKREALIL